MELRAKTATLAVAVMLTFAAMGFSQNITSMMVGDVTDSSGAAVPGADVTVTNQGTGTAAHTVTNAAGSYAVPNLLPGNYSVTCACV